MVFLTLIAWGLCYAIRNTYRYKITDRGAYFSGGLVFKTEKMVPFYKITNVIITQGPIQRMFGVSSIGVQTAGTGGVAMPEITYNGIVTTKKPYDILLSKIEHIRKRSRGG
ncbi:MAG: PH domain-containing protein [Candidatus Aenigmarchaeota archaeon]|nr:PH domain-containing protein [Candidatus Aenigmarchaeota archaeon]